MLGIAHTSDVDLLEVLAGDALDGQIHVLGPDESLIDVLTLKLGILLLDRVGTSSDDQVTLSFSLSIDDGTLLVNDSDSLTLLSVTELLLVPGGGELLVDLLTLLLAFLVQFGLKEVLLELNLGSLLLDLLVLGLVLLCLLADLKTDLLLVDSSLLINLASELGLLGIVLLPDFSELTAEVHLADLGILADLLTVVGLQVSEQGA